MGFFSNLFTATPPAGHRFPDLYTLELKIDDAIKKKKDFKVDINFNDLTREKWDYLSNKYRQLTIPVTHEFNRSYKFCKSRFNSVWDDILAGNPISMDSLDEENIGAFVAIELPGTKMNIVRPKVIKTGIAGFRFHDYKKKEVKEMLAMDPQQHLDPVMEPDNKYDIHAVKLMWEGYMLGYVPREYSTEVTKALEDQKDVWCYLESYDNYGSIDDRTRIEIRIDDVKAPRYIL